MSRQVEKRAFLHFWGCRLDSDFISCRIDLHAEAGRHQRGGDETVAAAPEFWQPADVLIC